MRLEHLGRVIAATLLAGVLAGVGSVGFHFIAERTDEILFTWAAAQRAVAHIPIVVLIPTVGMLLVGLFLQLVPQSRVGGVREVIDELEKRQGVVPMVRVLNVIMSGVVLAVGGSVGPEGPMVQWGALMGSQAGKLCGVSKRQLQAVVRAGAAAGIAAAFRSPAGAVLLTLEILGARFNRDLTAISIAAAVGYLVRISILGDAYPFRPNGPLNVLPTATLIIFIPLMGALAAVSGHFFIWLFDKWNHIFPQRWPLWFRVTLGGAMVGIIGIWFPQILSAGYPTIIDGVRGNIGFELFVVLLLFKMLGTSITFGSGAVGGVFAPTLVIGALFGGAFGSGLRAMYPWAVPQVSLFVLLGMVVMFGSIVKGYWSGLLMIADLSGSYHQLLLPGVIAGGISYLISWELRDRSILGLALDPAGRIHHPRERLAAELAPEPTPEPTVSR